MEIILDGREVKVDDKMFSLMLGWCTVESVCNSHTYPILLKTPIGTPARDIRTYDADGKAYKEGERLLFWDKPSAIVAPKPKVEVKRWRWVYFDGYKNCLRVTEGYYKDETEFSKSLDTIKFKLIQKVDSTEQIDYE